MPLLCKQPYSQYVLLTGKVDQPYSQYARKVDHAIRSVWPITWYICY